MTKAQKYPKILLVDDDISIRFALKKYLVKWFKKQGYHMQLFTAEDGVEGLGLIFAVNPDISIIDSTLPKYAGKEVVDYLKDNKKFEKKKTIVLIDNGKMLSLPENFVQISKKNINFLKILTTEIANALELKVSTPKNNNTRTISGQIIKFSNKATSSLYKARGSKLIVKPIYYLYYNILQFITSTLLLVLFIVEGRHIDEETIDQFKKDKSTFRTKKIPAYSFKLALIIFLVIQIGLISSIVGIGGFIVKKNVYAATYTWDGGGVTNNMSDCANWVGDVCPPANEELVFNSTSTKDAVIDAGFPDLTHNFTIASTYTGTITLQKNLSVRSFAQSGGIFDSGSYDFTARANFTLSNGASFIASSNTTHILLAINMVGGNFVHNGGLLDLTHSSGNTYGFACGNNVFNQVTLSTNGVLTIGADCNLPLGNNPTIPQNGSILLNGILSGSGTLNRPSFNAFNLNAGSQLQGFSGMISRFSINGGVYDFSSYSPLTSAYGIYVLSGSVILPDGTDFNNLLSISGGTLTAPSGTMSVAGNFTVTAPGVFIDTGGQIRFDGTTSAVIACGGSTFTSVALANTGGVKTINSDCVLPLGNNPTFRGVILNGELQGSGTLRTTTANTYNSTAILTGFDAIDSDSTTTINGANLELSSYTIFDSQGLVTMTSGNFILPSVASMGAGFTLSGGNFTSSSDNLTLHNNLSISGTPVFNANGGSITAAGINDSTWNCNGAIFNRVVLSKQWGAFTSDANCTLPLGDNPIVSNYADYVFNGPLNGTGVMNVNDDSSFTFNSGSSLTGLSGVTAISSAKSWKVSGANIDLSALATFNFSHVLTLESGTLSLPNDADLNSTLNVTGGIFNAPSGSIHLAGDLNISGSPTFNTNAGSIVLDGGSATLNCNYTPFNIVEINHNSGTKTVSSDCVLPMGANPTTSTGNILLAGELAGTGILDINGDMEVAAGGDISGFNTIQTRNFNLNGGTLNWANLPLLGTDQDIILTSGSITAPVIIEVGDDWNNLGATFNHNNATVKFKNGTASGGHDVIGTNTFFNLQKEATSTETIKFEAGVTQTIEGSLDLYGPTNSKLSLLSTNEGNQWNINVSGSNELLFTAVKDSNNVSPSYIQAAGDANEDLGNNTKWNFDLPQATFLNYADGQFVTDEKKPEISFEISDGDSSDQVEFTFQLDNNSNFSSPIIDVDQPMTSQGIFTYSPSTDLEDANYYLKVEASDQSGSSIGAQFANNGNPAFILDTTPPTGSVKIKEFGGANAALKVKLETSATDNLSGVKTTTISPYSDFRQTIELDYSTELEYQFITEGTKNLYVYYTDFAGNESPIFQTGYFSIFVPVATDTQSQEEQDSDTNELTSDSVEISTSDLENTYTLLINVIDLNSNTVKKVNVKLDQLDVSAITDKNGIATFENVGGGIYNLVIEYKDYSIQKTINVGGENSIIEVRVILDKEVRQSYEIQNILLCIVFLIAILILFLALTRLVKNKKQSNSPKPLSVPRTLQ